MEKTGKLKKELRLFDVYALSTGAMFSSGFFLLPGLAAAKAGPAVILAYLIAGILILPAMFSKAELSTALPRAGGAYYFLDRSLGPAFGTIGGLGIFFALSLKTAFALIGIGAYATIFVELPIKPVAIALTVAFVALNIVGAKETSGLQRILVVVLLTVLAFFVANGMYSSLGSENRGLTTQRLTPFMPNGFESLLSTIGFVFVSYAGLTKIASVAEEIENPDRNIPLGMMLSLVSTTFIYVVGVYIIVAVVEPSTLYSSLTPVADAVRAIDLWVPLEIALGLIVLSAVAAFVSTGNAGVLAASRYPFAMARDGLVSPKLRELGRFGTPSVAIITTGALIILFIVSLDEEGIAKLASAFQLFIFMLLNFAVIVMRESHIPSYDPGYKSPLYPWMQFAGIIFAIVLIFYLGWLSIVFTLGIVVVCLAWYYKYAHGRVERDGAIYHWFHRLGQRQYLGLDREFRTILREKGLRDEDPFHEIVARSNVIEVEPGESYRDVINEASVFLATRVPLPVDKIRSGFLAGATLGATPVAGGVALPHIYAPNMDAPEMVLARSIDGLVVEGVEHHGDAEASPLIHAVFLLVSPDENPGQHLRLLAEIANRVDDHQFLEQWLSQKSTDDLKELLLADDHHLTIHLRSEDASGHLIGKAVRDLDLPKNCLVAYIHRRDDGIIPEGNTVLLEGDRVTFIADHAALISLRGKYC